MSAIITMIMNMAVGCLWRYSDGEYSGVNIVVDVMVRNDMKKNRRDDTAMECIKCFNSSQRKLRDV